MPLRDMPRHAALVRLVLAVGVSTVLWAGVSATQDPAIKVTYASVPVTEWLPPGYYPVQSAGQVTVQVEGLRSDLADAPRPTAFVDLRRISTTTKQQVPVHVRLAPGVEQRDVRPRVVYLQLERQASTTVRVVVNGTGQLPAGYEEPLIATTPATVEVTGPSHIIDRIAGASLTVDYTTLLHDQSKEVEPLIVDGAGHGISRSVVRVVPRSVLLSVHVRAQRFHRLLPLAPNIVGVPAAGYRISGISWDPRLIEVVSNAPLPAETLMTTPITVDGLRGRRVVAAQLVVPPGLILRHVSQGIVTVTIAVAVVPGSAVSSAQVLVVGHRPGTRATLDRSSVTVVYQGPLAVLNAAPAPLAALDLGGRGPGTYYLRPAVRLATGLSLVSVSPTRVRVTIVAPVGHHARVKHTAPAPTPTPRPR